MVDGFDSNFCINSSCIYSNATSDFCMVSYKYIMLLYSHDWYRGRFAYISIHK